MWGTTDETEETQNAQLQVDHPDMDVWQQFAAIQCRSGV